MNKIVRSLIVCVMVALVCLTLALPVLAGEKDHEKWFDDYYIENDTICPFPLTAHVYGTVKFTQWVTNDGCLGYRFQEANVKYDIYAAGHPENSLAMHFQGPFVIQDLVEDGSVWTEKMTGQFQHITIPGYGSVTGLAGQSTVKVTCTEEDCVVDVIKDSGLRLYSQEATDEFCGYLQP